MILGRKHITCLKKRYHGSIFMSFLLKEKSSNTGHANTRYLFTVAFLHLRILIKKVMVNANDCL